MKKRFDPQVPDLLTDIKTNTAGLSGTNIAIDPTKDASGRARIGLPVTFLSGSSYLGKDSALDNEVTSGGGETSVESGGVVEMSITANGEYVIRQSRDRAPYLSGKSQNPEWTFNQFDLEAGVEKECGYFSSAVAAPHNTVYDGIRMYNDGANYYVQIWNNGTQLNSGADEQATWYDPLDGTGPSEITYDFSKFTIVLADFLYLGGSDVRIFIRWEDNFHLFFCYNHAGKKDGLIMASPNQPIRYGIRSTGGTSGTFGASCYVVNSEGSEVVNYKGGGVSLDNDDHINCNTAGTRYAIIGLRLNDRKASVRIDKVTILGTTTDDFKWELVLDPTIAAGAVYSAVSGYPVDRGHGDLTDPGASTSTVTGGTVLRNGYGRQQTSEAAVFENLQQRIGEDIDGTFSEIWLVITPLSSNADIRGTLDFDVLK